jgi:hypothetical protein
MNLITTEQMEGTQTLGQPIELESNAKPVIYITIIFTIIAYIFGTYFINLGQIDDWNKIRCQPHVMPLASLYGYDTTENFNYCMKANFEQEAKQYMGPIYQMFGGFVGVLSTLVEVGRKMKVGFATLYGGVQTIMSEFTERLKQFFIRIEVASQRMKMLMYRVYTTMFAVVFMAMSGITAVTNFGGTVLFDVIDTFCFAPETEIFVIEKGYIPIQSVQLGDMLANGEKVTSIFAFYADGQKMVSFQPKCGAAPIIVSTNHYVLYRGKYIRSDAHPFAKPTGRWTGGVKRPLICLNTTSNCIPIREFVFRDYDETSDAHFESIADIHRKLNQCELIHTNYTKTWHEYIPAFDPCTSLKMKHGYKKIADIQLGEHISFITTVVGKIQHSIQEVCYIESDKTHISPGVLLYHEQTSKWLRAGDIYNVIKLDKPIIFENIITIPGSILELESGQLARDYLEIASPDTAAPYAAALMRIVETNTN